MNTPSSFLYDLVKNLSKSERRYIKVWSGDQGRDYIQLMDALIAQNTFDEQQLIRDHKEANFVKHLAVNKRYLYELLLKLLYQFGQRNIENIIYEKIAAVKVLIEKGLYRAASSELKKGRKVAVKHELFELQIVLIDLEKKLLYRLQQKDLNPEAIYQIFQKEQDCLEQLKNTSEYWYLAQQISQFQLQYQKIQTTEQQIYLDQLMKSPKLQNLSLATNTKSQLYYYQANASYQFVTGGIEKAYEINRTILDLLDENPNFLKLYAERYLATLNNILIDSLIMEKHDILEIEINRLTNIEKRPEFKSINNIESRVFRQRNLLLINWSLGQKNFEKALQWIPDIKKGLNRFGKKIEKHHRVTFYYLSAYTLFLNRRFEEALEWNNYILNDPKDDVVKELFNFARLLNLLIHYELNNYNLLESLLLSTPKYLKSRRTLYKSEKALFRFLDRLLNTIDPRDKQTIANNFNKEIRDLFHDPKEKIVFNYLDLRLWNNGLLMITQ